MIRLASLMLFGTGCIVRTVSPASPASPPPVVESSYGGGSYGGGSYGGGSYGGGSYGGGSYTEQTYISQAPAPAPAPPPLVAAEGGNLSVVGVTADGVPYAYASASASASASTSSGTASSSSTSAVSAGSMMVATSSSNGRFDEASLAIARTFLHSIASTHGMYTSLLRFVNDSSGRASMLAGASDGGFFVAAARRTPTSQNEYANIATVYRVDRAGSVRWTANVGDVGYATFELMSVVATPDGGAIAQVLAYKHPARNPNTRFVKLDREGRRVWVQQLPGTGNTDCPHAEVVSSDGRGGLTLHGYWVRSAELSDRHDWSGHLRDWFGSISADGSLVRSEVGEVMASGRIGTWPAQDPMWNSIAPVL